MTENQCEICSNRIAREPIIHVAGFPERAHKFCSIQCRDRFLRMEDDELGYKDWKKNKKAKDKRRFE